MESPGASYPKEWLDLPCHDPQFVKLFASPKRAATLKKPGEALQKGQGVLQCCVLVVDSRLNHRGNILALSTGREETDPRNRWQETVKPGRVAAPLVFCCACLPGGSAHHIVAHSARITGSRLGFDIVHNFIEGLNLETTLPDKQHANEELPEGGGQWTMVFNDRGVAAFVWMGVEAKQGEEVLLSSEQKKLISHASLALATELHQQARKLLRSTPVKKP